MRNDRGRITGILILALMLRLTWALVQPRTPAAIALLPDQQEYLSLGQNLLREGALSFIDPRFGQRIWAYRMPGYPAVIAACGGSVIAVRLLQCVVDTSTVVAVWLIARSLPRRDTKNKGDIPNYAGEKEECPLYSIVAGENKGDIPIFERNKGDCPLCWRRMAAVAAGLVAVNPFLIYFSGLILSETFFTALLAWGLLFFPTDGY